jgi:hypothetical protein
VPTLESFEARDAEGQVSLERDLIGLNDSKTVRETMMVPSDYLKVATRKRTTMVGHLLRAGKSPSLWRWNNIPLPEPHMVGFLASGVLHLARPWRLPGSRQLYSSAGWTLLGAGVAISASAVRAAAFAPDREVSAHWRIAASHSSQAMMLAPWGSIHATGCSSRVSNKRPEGHGSRGRARGRSPPGPSAPTNPNTPPCSMVLQRGRGICTSTSS